MARQTALLWGPTQSGKSSLCASFARGYHEQTGKRVRLVTAESAQCRPIYAELVESGIVTPWYMDATKKLPFERLWQACLGYWPEDTTEPLSRMIPAFTYRYRAACAKCSVTPYDQATAPTVAVADQLKCLKCKDPLMVKTVRIPNPANGIDKIGAYLFDGGLTEFSQMMMDDMGERVARNETLGGANEKQGGDVAIRFLDGTYAVGGNTQSQYGAAQRQIKLRVDETKGLDVDYVIWTAVEADDRDAANKRQGRVFGPKVSGTAATADIPRWFGPTLGTRFVPKHGQMQADEHRLYMRTYFQSWDGLDAKVPNLCNNRIPPHRLDGIPEYYTIAPGEKTKLWQVMQEIEKRMGLPALARVTATKATGE